MAKKFLQPFLSARIPAHVLEQYPLFIDFMKAYYEWLEQDGNAYNVLTSLEKLDDIDETIDAFKDYIHRQFLVNIPSSVLVDKDLLVKRIKEFYVSKGTESSLRFLMKILFDDDIDVYYPKNDIIRTSDGKWVSDRIRIRISVFQTPTFFVGQTILQRDPQSDVVIARGLVQEVVELNLGYYHCLQLELSDTIGTFVENLPISLINTTNDDVLGVVYPQISSVSGLAAGTGYFPGQIYHPSTALNYKYPFIADEDQSIFNTYLTTSLAKAQIVVKKHLAASGSPVTTLPSNHYDWDGQILTITNIASLPVDGEIVEIFFPSHQATINVSETTVGGVISAYEIIDQGIGFTELADPQTITGFGSGTATFNTTISGGFPVPGYYVNQDGHISANKYIPDGEYYQDFSYVILSKINFDQYKDILKRILHPAGLKNFGQFQYKKTISFLLSTVVQMDIRVEQKDIIIFGYPKIQDDDYNYRLKDDVEFAYLYAPSLGTTNRTIDAQKGTFWSDFKYDLITSLTRSGLVATATSYNNHNLIVGCTITIAGADQTEYNGTFVVTSVTSNQFTFTLTGTPTTPATGTIVWAGQEKQNTSIEYIDSVVENTQHFTDSIEYAVISITRAGNKAQVNVGQNHHLEDGMEVYIGGVNNSEYTGIKTVELVPGGPTIFRYTVSGEPETPAYGTPFYTLLTKANSTNQFGIPHSRPRFLDFTDRLNYLVNFDPDIFGANDIDTIIQGYKDLA